jgi:hypothetical protein
MTDDILLDYRITNDHGKFVAIDSTDEVVYHGCSKSTNIAFLLGFIAMAEEEGFEPPRPFRV